MLKGSTRLLRPFLGGGRSTRALVMILVLTTWPYVLYTMRGTGVSFGSPGLKGAANGYQGDAHVRVAVRVHKQQDLLLRSLVWALRAQQTVKIKTDFVLIPTEPNSLAFFQDLALELNGQVKEPDVYVLKLPDSFFSEGRAKNPYLCSRDVRKAYEQSEGKDDTHRICDFDHYVYYLATDKGLTDMVATCESCTHAIVTNGDNMYAPGFLRETLRRNRDMVATGFCHAGMAYEAKMALGHIDLGAVLIKKEVLRDGAKTFLNSLPAGSKAKQVHDADYWFFQEAVDRGATVAIVDQVSFYHH